MLRKIYHAEIPIYLRSDYFYSFGCFDLACLNAVWQCGGPVFRGGGRFQLRVRNKNDQA